MKKFSDNSLVIVILSGYSGLWKSHVETNVCLCRIYVRVPDMEIGRTTKEGLTADK